MATRRRFLAKAGLAGAAAGLAHFMLLGGDTKKVFAANDACATSPFTEAAGDVCAVSQSDDDKCVVVGTTELGDECREQDDDEDTCTVVGRVVVGDECPGLGDVCLAANAALSQPEVDDECGYTFDTCVNPFTLGGGGDDCKPPNDVDQT